MSQRISRGTKKRIEHSETLLDNITANAGRISTDALHELYQRASIPSQPDGYAGSSALGEKSSGGGEPTSSTENAVYSKNYDREGNPKQARPDVVQMRAREIEKLLIHADSNLRTVIHYMDYLQLKTEEARQRPTSVPCMICNELAAEVSGYCRPDYDNWCDHGRPDRAIWQMYKQKTVNSDFPDPQLLVPDCPPPSSGRTARRGPHKGITG